MIHTLEAEQKEYPFIDCQQILDCVILVSFFVGDISLLAELGKSQPSPTTNSFHMLVLSDMAVAFSIVGL